MELRGDLAGALARLIEVEDAGPHAVVSYDPESGMCWVYGPYASEEEALGAMAKTRGELDACGVPGSDEDLSNVQLRLGRMRPPGE